MRPRQAREAPATPRGDAQPAETRIHRIAGEAADPTVHLTLAGATGWPAPGRPAVPGRPGRRAAGRRAATTPTDPAGWRRTRPLAGAASCRVGASRRRKKSIGASVRPSRVCRDSWRPLALVTPSRRGGTGGPRRGRGNVLQPRPRRARASRRAKSVVTPPAGRRRSPATPAGRRRHRRRGVIDPRAPGAQRSVVEGRVEFAAPVGKVGRIAPAQVAPQVEGRRAVAAWPAGRSDGGRRGSRGELELVEGQISARAGRRTHEAGVAERSRADRAKSPWRPPDLTGRPATKTRPSARRRTASCGPAISSRCRRRRIRSSEVQPGWASTRSRLRAGWPAASRIVSPPSRKVGRPASRPTGWRSRRAGRGSATTARPPRPGRSAPGAAKCRNPRNSSPPAKVRTASASQASRRSHRRGRCRSGAPQPRGRGAGDGGGMAHGRSARGCRARKRPARDACGIRL